MIKDKQALLFVGLCVACNYTVASEVQSSKHDNDGINTKTIEQHEVEQAHSIHWGYSGPEGPAQWHALSDDYALCGSGKRQSPINLQQAESFDLYPLTFNYNAVPLQVVNNGHTLQANYNKPNNQTVTIGGETFPLAVKTNYESHLMIGSVSYDLLQFHFHSPSEHASEGDRHVMEVHLVHKSADGNLAVVGVFLDSGKENTTLKKMMSNLSDTINEVSVVNTTRVNANGLLPKDHDFYHYSGSLTTPPCSENVNWYVMKQHIEVSGEQVRRFASLVGENSRPLQTMHWRTLLTSK